MRLAAVFRKMGRALGIRSGDAAFFALLLFMSLLANVGMAWKIRRLLNPHIVAVTGVRLAPFIASNIDGKPQLVTFDGTTPTVLYVLNPNCGWCARNLQNIRELAAARKDSDRFIGISLNDPNLKEYVKKSQLGFPVVSIAGYSSIKELPLGVTPETIVVSPTGQVIKNWLGAYAFGQEKEVEKYFGVKLPGLLAGAEGSSTASH